MNQFTCPLSGVTGCATLLEQQSEANKQISRIAGGESYGIVVA